MQWLPDTIDAFARLYAQTGAIGFVAFVGIVGLMLILWRHLGSLIPIVSGYVEHDRRASARVIDELSQIKASNAQIVDRVSKLPSDVPICKAQSREETASILKEFLAANGWLVTDAEAEILLAHRKEVRDKMAVTTMEQIPIPKQEQKR